MVKILDERKVSRGKLLRLRAMDKEVSVLLTWHLIDAIENYDFPQEKILDFLLFPDEVLTSSQN